ncbi:hypothetical protein EX30DRAFT_352214 [Ascodesmis nigricans]|uniref:Uncharacterized protein n=1 Tax=Ascodesmis nigricans TaxID=341454 RepID=A0A4V3SHP0_9PEZI|nr:hypothetical protein EX30DRAFT_352214 [Ascodesmis nigricans]
MSLAMRLEYCPIPHHLIITLSTNHLLSQATAQTTSTAQPSTSGRPQSQPRSHPIVDTASCANFICVANFHENLVAATDASLTWIRTAGQLLQAAMKSVSYPPQTQPGSSNGQGQGSAQSQSPAKNNPLSNITGMFGRSRGPTENKLIASQNSSSDSASTSQSRRMNQSQSAARFVSGSQGVSEAGTPRRGIRRTCGERDNSSS